MPTYFLPLRAGGHKKWGTKRHDFWCCHGTMVQAQCLYPELIYYEDAAADTLYINQYIPSEYHFTLGGASGTIRQTTAMKAYNAQALFDEKDDGQMSRWLLKFEINAANTEGLTLALRVPSWCHGILRVQVNEEDVASPVIKDGFLYFTEGLDPEIKDAVYHVAEVLKEKGAIVEEFDLGMVEYAIPAYYIIASAEASSNLERFDGVKYGYRTAEYTDLHNMYKKTRSEGFGAEVKRRIMLGSFTLSSGYYDAYYVKALKVKALIKQAYDKAFAKYDIILGPVAPTTALTMGESLSDPIKMYLGDVYTVPVNLAGLPVSRW